MIHAGTDIKWKVTVEMAGYDFDEDDAELVITNRWGHVAYRYAAENFYGDGDGHWYFNTPNVKDGIYYATMTCYRGDEDFNGQYQKVTDRQKLVTVGACNCECHGEDRCQCACHETDGMKVTYERVWTVNFIDGQYLADCNGNPILDRDGNYIRFSDKVPESKDVRINMTAAEFKRWMDEKDNNGKIDTRKEIEEALGGAEEETEYTELTGADVDNIMDSIFGTQQNNND